MRGTCKHTDKRVCQRTSTDKVADDWGPFGAFLVSLGVPTSHNTIPPTKTEGLDALKLDGNELAIECGLNF